MNIENIKKRIDNLLEVNEVKQLKIHGSELQSATTSLFAVIYGKGSVQLQDFYAAIETIRSKEHLANWSFEFTKVSHAHLLTLKAEVEMNLIGSLEKTISGELLTDFLKLSRASLDEKGDDAKNVSAVLAAALFEDTIRRLATFNGIPHTERLADVLTELKNKTILDGTQVGVAQSYLTFRNKSLHAEWDKVGRETVASVLAFTEQLLLKHFSWEYEI